MKSSTKKIFNILFKYFFFSFFVCCFLYSNQVKDSASEGILFSRFPQITLLVKEQYVEPNRINPGSMLAAALEPIEAKIAKLVITLPKSLQEKTDITANQAFLPIEKKSAAKDIDKEEPATKKEQIIVEMGPVKKSFDFDVESSLWGVTYLLEDLFGFIETEGNKQGLTKESSSEDPVNWEKLSYLSINSMLAKLDPHTVLLEPEFSRDLDVTVKGEFGGVGMVLSSEKSFITVISPIDDTPAAKAGIKAQDRIIKINDTSAINMNLSDAVSLLRGEPGTSVKITTQTANKITEHELKRAIIKVESVAYALLEDTVGYLRVKAFQGNTAQDVTKGILDLKKKSKNKLKNLILDLRDNPGGLLKEAIDISNLFLDGGEIVSTQGASTESKQVEYAQKGQLDPSLKIAVLINPGSASASEIVASAIRYRDRGITVGERTFGKGTVQTVIEMNKAAAKITIAQYFGPNNKIIQTLGVGPDIKLHEVRAEKKDDLSLFSSPLVREIDLDAHLQGKGSLDEKPLFSINYLSPIKSEEEEKTNAYGKLDAKKLQKDFAVVTAKELLKSSSGPTKAELLKNAEKVVEKLKIDQEKNIAEALKKFAIDWQPGDYKAKESDLTAKIVKNEPALAGEKLKISIDISNTSDTDVYQVHGITQAKTSLFDKKEILFGKIKPKEKINREMVFEIPKDVVSRRDLITLEIRDQALQKIKEINIPIELKGLKRPILSFKPILGEAKINPDFPDQKEHNLILWIKNIGEGKAFEPTALLKTEMTDKIFIEKGRDQSGELLPNQETPLKFTFRLKEKIDQGSFEIQLFDGQMHDLWHDKIVLNLKEFDSSPENKWDDKDKKSTKIVYDHKQPKVDLFFGDNSGVAKTSLGSLKAKITNAENIKDIMLYLNGKKILYKNKANKNKELILSHNVNLKPGVNIISLVAKENAFFGQQENITVYYDEQKKFAYNKDKNLFD